VSEVKRPSLVKPTLETPFHIDFEWWRKNDRDWRIYLWSNLCPMHQQVFADVNTEVKIDWVDPITAEVRQIDGLQHTLMNHCARQPGFITQHTALVDAAFRLFLANGNTPMNAIELGKQLGRDPMTILRTFTGGRIYKGIRPKME